MCILSSCRFRIPCNPEICQAPVTLVEENILRLEIPVDNIFLKAGQGFSHIEQNVHCLIHVQSVSCLKVLTKRFLSTWHHQNVVVVPLACI